MEQKSSGCGGSPTGMGAMDRAQAYGPRMAEFVSTTRRVYAGGNPQGQKHNKNTPRKGRGEWGKWFLEGALAEVGESFEFQHCYRS